MLYSKITITMSHNFSIKRKIKVILNSDGFQNYVCKVQIINCMSSPFLFFTVSDKCVVCSYCKSRDCQVYISSIHH